MILFFIFYFFAACVRITFLKEAEVEVEVVGEEEEKLQSDHRHVIILRAEFPYSTLEKGIDSVYYNICAPTRDGMEQ